MVFEESRGPNGKKVVYLKQASGMETHFEEVGWLTGSERVMCRMLINYLINH